MRLIFIGPKSDHCKPLSLTHLLTESCCWALLVFEDTYSALVGNPDRTVLVKVKWRLTRNDVWSWCLVELLKLYGCHYCLKKLWYLLSSYFGRNTHSLESLTMFTFIASSSNNLTRHIFRRRGKNLIAAHNCRRKKLNEAEVMSQIT